MRPSAADSAAIWPDRRACLAIYTAFVPRITAYLNPLTGDEPFYVMTALSLAHDHDLNETNNYAQGDYAPSTRPIPPRRLAGLARLPARSAARTAAHADRPGIYSKHGLGVAVLIMLPYVLGGRDAIILFLNFIAALVAAEHGAAGADATATPWRGAGAGGAAGARQSADELRLPDLSRNVRGAGDHLRLPAQS